MRSLKKLSAWGLVKELRVAAPTMAPNLVQRIIFYSRSLWKLLGRAPTANSVNRIWKGCPWDKKRLQVTRKIFRNQK